MSARLAAFVIWAAVAASAAYWGLRLFVAPPRAPAHATTAAPAPLRGDLARVFGAAPDEPAAAVAAAPQAARFALVGVASPRQEDAREGVALIAVDGKPARVYRVGAAVDGDWHLQSVQPRGASLGPVGGAPALKLELPPLAPPATGSLPPATPTVPAPGVSMNPQPIPLPITRPVTSPVMQPGVQALPTPPPSQVGVPRPALPQPQQGAGQLPNLGPPPVAAPDAAPVDLLPGGGQIGNPRE